jgi:membrane dipeptidase
MKSRFLVDAHLDLALNALEWNRDLTRPIGEIRAAEAGMDDKPGRGQGTVNFTELRRGGIGLVVTTQIARIQHDAGCASIATWHSPAQAWAMTQAQLAWYRAMEEAGEMRAIVSREDLDGHVDLWLEERGEAATPSPIGYVLSLEGADSLVTLAYLERAYEYGLRAVGPAHYGSGVYAQGTGTTGGFPPRGRELLAEMDRLGMILDVTHLSDECFWEALDSYSGPVWASHHNCRALVPFQRQLTDDQIRALAAREAVIGVAFDGWMLVPGWVQGRTLSEETNVKLEVVINHIDHICQIAGNASHVGLGSDLDGGFGREQSPLDLDTIADLQRLPEMLLARGYSAEDAENFSSGNFLRFLRGALK